VYGGVFAALPCSVFWPGTPSLPHSERSLYAFAPPGGYTVFERDPDSSRFPIAPPTPGHNMLKKR
jgi:hypothetical protein